MEGHMGIPPMYLIIMPKRGFLATNIIYHIILPRIFVSILKGTYVQCASECANHSYNEKFSNKLKF